MTGGNCRESNCRIVDHHWQKTYVLLRVRRRVCSGSEEECRRRAVLQGAALAVGNGLAAARQICCPQRGRAPDFGADAAAILFCDCSVEGDAMSARRDPALQKEVVNLGDRGGREEIPTPSRGTGLVGNLVAGALSTRRAHQNSVLDVSLCGCINTQEDICQESENLKILVDARVALVINPQSSTCLDGVRCAFQRTQPSNVRPWI